MTAQIEAPIREKEPLIVGFGKNATILNYVADGSFGGDVYSINQSRCILVDGKLSGKAAERKEALTALNILSRFPDTVIGGAAYIALDQQEKEIKINARGGGYLIGWKRSEESELKTEIIYFGRDEDQTKLNTAIDRDEYEYLTLLSDGGIDFLADINFIPQQPEYFHPKNALGDIYFLNLAPSLELEKRKQALISLLRPLTGVLNTRESNMRDVIETYEAYWDSVMEGLVKVSEMPEMFLSAYLHLLHALKKRNGFKNFNKIMKKYPERIKNHEDMLFHDDATLILIRPQSIQ
jgi:hypothetical protein